MAVAAKPVRETAKTEYQKQLPPRVLRRHRKKRNLTVIRVVACTVSVVAFLGYIGMYAQVTRCGYHAAELSRQIRQAEMENQSLKAEIQMLSSPGRLSAAATNSGMQPSTESIFIVTQESTTVAKAE